MIELKLRPGTPGCVRVPLGCLTLGLMPLLSNLGTRHFVKRMDELGVETRGGKRVAWGDVTRARRVRGGLKSNTGTVLATLSDEYLLESPSGRVSVPLWRTENATEVRDFMLAHLPPGVLN